MKTAFKKSFLKALKKVKNEGLKKAIKKAVLEVETADHLQQIKNLKKLAGYDVFYRIRIGEYRMGLKVESDTVYFVVFEHRKDVYKGFP